MWIGKIKSHRKRYILLAVLLSLFFVSVVYATNYNQPITDTLNLLASTNYWYKGISDSISFSNSPNSWFAGITNALGFSLSSNLYFSGLTDTFGFCVNVTATGFNNCGSTIAFSLTGSGVIQTITLTGCSVSPTSVSGNGNPVTLTTNPVSGCQFTAHLPSGYLFTGNSQQNEFFTSGFNAILSDTYYNASPSGSITQTVVIYQTTFIIQNGETCTNSADCGSNQLGAFIGSLLPSLIIILISLFAVHEIGGDSIDGRIYILTFMFAISADGFLSAAGAFGIYGIPWYIPIFCDIIGLVLLLGNRASSTQI